MKTIEEEAEMVGKLVMSTAALRRPNESGSAVLLIEQNARLAVTQRAYVLERPHRL
jgi:ABC-type branched-subunit amino acid transport system ATPase component